MCKSGEEETGRVEGCSLQRGALDSERRLAPLFALRPLPHFDTNPMPGGPSFSLIFWECYRATPGSSGLATEAGRVAVLTFRFLAAARLSFILSPSRNVLHTRLRSPVILRLFLCSRILRRPLRRSPSPSPSLPQSAPSPCSLFAIDYNSPRYHSRGFYCRLFVALEAFG